LDDASVAMSDLQIAAVVDGDAVAPVAVVVVKPPGAAAATTTTPAVKGSRLPFFQKLRRNTSAEKEKEKEKEKEREKEKK